MQLISHQNHINALPNSPLKTHIQNRFNQIIEESEDIPPIFLLVEPDDDITGPDFSIVGPRDCSQICGKSTNPDTRNSSGPTSGSATCRS